MISEAEAQEAFERESNNQWYAPGNGGRHACCRLEKGPAFRDGIQRPEVLSLCLLRCCRQIYHETHHIPYSTNTFSFTNPETLQSFAVSLAQGSDGNHLAIRSLFLETVYANSHHVTSWEKATATCAKQLKALRIISISIELRHPCPRFLEPNFVKKDVKCWKKKGVHSKDDVMSSILKLKNSPLQSVTMVVTDQKAFGSATFQQSLPRWTLSAKREWAHCAKAILLLRN